MSLSLKRIISDINSLKKTPLDKEGIYWNVDENNIYNIYAIIIGPKDTPYEGGFFFFKFIFPESYPLEPPKAEFHTLYSKIRFNPNLYTNGYVCLSILNTWHGPSWTPCNTLSSILISLLGLVFVEHPLVNEPGHEYDSYLMLDSYDAIIEYETYRIACLCMLDNVPAGFEIFKEKIEDYFVKNYDSYLERAKNLKCKRNNKKYVSCYGLSAICNYDKIIDMLEIKYKKLNNISDTLPKMYKIGYRELQDLCVKYSIDLQKIDINGKKKYKKKMELYNEIKNVI
jgi:ubiquitin-conjugating enzyme E2 Z